MAAQDRAQALARLAELGAPTAASAPAEAPVARSEREVYAGGDTPRLLVRRAHLTYREDGDVRYAMAEPGDVVLLTAKQAQRLDELGATVDPDADEEEVAEVLNEGSLTDEQLRAMNAADLVAHVAQNPEDRERVRTLEEERDNPRKTVLEATADEGDEDDEDPEA